MIPVASPTITDLERKYVQEVMESGWISSTGDFLTKFENKFAEFCNTNFAVMTNNGTTALHLALLALDLKQGEEVIVPVLTYIATANAVSYCGAKPVFVDVFADGTIDCNELEKAITPKTVGVIAVHLYGIPANMNQINEIAKNHRLWVVEDAAEAHGATLHNRIVGSISEIGVFSFYGNKIISTGEGGALVTNNPVIANKARLLRGQGMDLKRRYYFPTIGYNYRMTNLAAAIGLAQLERIREIQDRRQEIRNHYNILFKNFESLEIFDKGHKTGSKCWLYSILLSEDLSCSRDDLQYKLHEAGIETRPFFQLLTEMPPYFENRKFKVGEELSRKGLNLPTFFDLQPSQIEYIVENIRKLIEK